MRFSLSLIPRFFRKLVLPVSLIGGLEIKDSAIRIARFQNGILKKSAAILEPGVIDNGKVKDRPRLIESLKKMHSQFAGTNEKIPVILIVPSSNIYTQVFSTPFLPEANLEDAAKLNLVSISPIDLSVGYADWQQVGIQERDGKLEILGAFSNSAVIDEYVQCLSESGFISVAVEFPALAIARAIKEYGSGIDIDKPQVVLNVSSDGIDFMVLRHGNLYFDYFTPWKLIQGEGRSGREILFSDFKETIISEIKKVSAFYGSHWEGKLDKLILVTQALNSEIKNFIKENFNFDIIEPKLSGFPDAAPSWFGVIGSAIRGKISRSEDNLISLMAIGTEEEYFQAEAMFFIKAWRSVILAIAGFVAIFFLLVDSFLYQASGQLTSQLQEISSGQGQEIAELQGQAEKFNNLVEKSALAKEQDIPWSPFFSKINSVVKKDMSLTRIFVDTKRTSVLLSGTANDEATAVNFKNSLIEEGFKNVSLPLSNIVINSNKTVSFTITFKL